MKLKKMSRNQFQKVLDFNWDPVEIDKQGLPEWMNGMPLSIICKVTASGSDFSDQLYHSRTIASGTLVAGMDVWRYAPDDPVKYNKDLYGVVATEEESCYLVEDLPKDEEHWSNEIPPRLRDIKTIQLPKNSIIREE